MTLTLNLPPATEARLRERAAASKREAADYALEILEQALGNDELSESEHPLLPDTSRQVIEDFLKRVEHIEPDPNRPRLRGLEAEIARSLSEKERRGRS